MEYLDLHPEIFLGRDSTTYDLVYRDKLYPPLLVLSKANELKGFEKLTIRDFNNNTKIAFKYLVDNGFQVNEKQIKTNVMEEFYNLLMSFIEQSGTNDLKYKRFSVNFLDTTVKASFGQGGPAKIPWISFTINPNTTSNGIYPVYLFYKELNLLILAYGVSETNSPRINWPPDFTSKTIKEFFNENYSIKPERYGSSYIYKVYNVNDLPSEEIINNDLSQIIDQYKNVIQNNVAENDIKLSDQIPFNFQSYYESLAKSNLKFDETLVKRFVASLITKPFVILTGLAGSGKTKIAQSFMQWICEDENQYKIVPVGADWINREPLLGYPNGLKADEYVMPDNGVLELMIEASAPENQDKPYFILLDEMNLSHVERYFADFLSIMESEDSIKLYTGANRKSTAELNIPATISWPENLFIVGTVNIDETTYMFSPKVLDRANVIEFRLNENDIENFLSDPKKADLSQLIAQGANMGNDFIKLSNSTATETDETLKTTLLEFFKELKTIGSEFGYRSAFEIQLLYAQFNHIDNELKAEDKIDFAVMQKLLPKLHGSRSKIVKTLEALMRLCLNNTDGFSLDKLPAVEDSNIKYRITFEKLIRMYSNALNNGFTSYAEA